MSESSGTPAAAPATARKSCFVLSQIGEDGSAPRKSADLVLKHLIRKALGDEFTVKRADDDTDPGAITPRIVASIIEADLIIADLSGLNANVFYELAIAHGYNKPTVHIQQKDQRPPFDVKDMRVVRYDITDLDDVEKAQKTLRSYAESALKSPGKIVTPLSSAVGFVAVEKSDNPVADSNMRVLQAVEELRLEIRASRRSGRHNNDFADITALRSVIESAVDSERLTPEDFRGAASNITSSAHDEFVRRQMARLHTGWSQDEIEEFLFLKDDDDTVKDEA